MTALAIEAPLVITGRIDVAAHPRGRGFGVLSRIARVQSAEEYTPRHRLDEPELVTAYAE